MAQQPTSRYAKAFFDLCRDNEKIDSAHRDLRHIYKLIEDSYEFTLFLENPIIPSEKRRDILENLFKGRLDSITYRYILFLEQKNRLPLLKAICGAFEHLYRDWKGIEKVKIFSSIELSHHQLDAICNHLRLKLNKQIEPQCEIDAHMIGGIKIQIGDRIYDYSFQTQLERFKKGLIPAA